MARPSSYNSKYINSVDEFVKQKVEVGEIPTVEGFSVSLGHHKDTIYEWIKKYPKFSDAIKKLLSYQAQMLQTNGLSQKYNPTMAIFLLKNNHGFKDKTEIDTTSKGERIVGINYIVPEGRIDDTQHPTNTETGLSS